jgi:hypothetical protein
MTKTILLLVTACSLYGCGGSSEESDANSIIGDWYIEFERNGATGESHLVISESNMDTYEIGNGQIMDEWYSGLGIDKSYKFTVDGYEGTYTINGNTLTTSISMGQSNTARILELPNENEIYSWEINNANAGEEYSYDYQLVNGSLVVTTSNQEEYIYTLTSK